MVICIFEKFEHTFDIKSIDKEKRIIRGIASLEEVDRDNEIIATEAIERSLQTYLINPVIRYKHTDPIGRAIIPETSIDRANKAFIVTAYITDKTEKAREAWGLIEDGIIKSFSVGGKVLEKEAIKENGKDFHKITKMELYEVSVVDIPSNRKSFFEVIAKSLEKEVDDRDTELIKKTVKEVLFIQENKEIVQEANALLTISKPGVHSDKWHRCVQHVREQGGVESPEAVCTAQLGEESFNRSVKLTEEDVKEIDSFVKKLNSYLLEVKKLDNIERKYPKHHIRKKDIESCLLKLLKLGDMEHMTDESKNKMEEEQCQK